MIESMACGTPVIAFRHGSVPEIMEDGRSGFIVEDVEHAIKAVNRLSEVSREDCRGLFEERFTAARMASDYVKVFQTLINEQQPGSED